jgi:hypothetical protein
MWMRDQVSLRSEAYYPIGRLKVYPAERHHLLKQCVGIVYLWKIDNFNLVACFL